MRSVGQRRILRGGLSPLFSSDRFTPPDASRLDLVDLLEDKKDKLYVGLGTASTILVLESITVVVKRFLGGQ